MLYCIYFEVNNRESLASMQLRSKVAIHKFIQNKYHILRRPHGKMQADQLNTIRYVVHYTQSQQRGKVRAEIRLINHNT